MDSQMQRSPRPLISHTPLRSLSGPHPVLRLVSSADLAGVGAGVVQFGGSSSSAVGCYKPCIQCVPLPARDRDEYSFLMTSDLSLGGGVWELAVEWLSHGQSPLRIQRPPCPIHTPYTTPHGALAIPSLVPFSASTLAERPLAVSTDHTHRIPPPRISTTAGNCFPSRTARSLWRLNHRVPASQRTHRVYVAASRMHLHCRMWVAARRTRCR
jgi:hypothetical protein